MIFLIIKSSRLQLILRSLIVIGSSLLLTVILQIFQFRDVKAGIAWFFKYHSILGLTTAGIIFVFYLALIGIFNRFWYATGLLYFILLIFGFANSQKSMLRDEPLLPSDLAMYKEANSLIGMISIKSVLILLAVLIIGIGLTFWLQHHFKRDKGLPWYFRVLILVPCCLTIGGIFTLNHANSISNKFATKIKDSRDFWNPLSGAITNGPLLSFINNVDSEVMAKPKNYNEKNMSIIAKRYQKYATAINKTRPNSNLNKQTLIYTRGAS
jgi:phosphoglycerol transferase MdoB-like AlkP superfamily enzyme